MLENLVAHFWEVSAITSIISATITGVIAVILMKILKDRSLSRYDELRHQAELSEIRKAYDSQIHNLTMTLMATETRWKEINHLLLSAQRLQPELTTTNVTHTNFLKTAGINQDDLVIDPKLIFVLTPFDPMYQHTYRIIVGVCQRVGLVCLRGDEDYADGDILSHILKIMVRARLVIANISARNPNVFYELGIAHAIDKPTILISESLDQVPFDVQSKRVLLYKSPEQLDQQLRDAMLRILSETVH
jgi:hypothetical protein